MAESVKVIVRCRPMNDREKGLKCVNVITMDPTRGQCSITNPGDRKAPPKMFTFDGAYKMDSTTDHIYGEVTCPLVEGVTEGYNGTIFAYGQTGSGKSFSMQGITQPSSQRGIIPRAFNHIFETISIKQGIKFLIHASFLEIYNEDIRDLLGKDVKQKLELKEHPDKGVYVSGLSMHPVHNVTECEHIMNKGWHNRSTGATLMNAESSRSHSIFTIYLEMVTKDDAGEDHIRAGKLNLVDLAGSERQGKTGATGDRLKEATKINLSLSALGNVISALVDGKSKHIPYRDSKLTRLLQDSLGGNTKTMMVACLSPADNNYDETLSTLRYANRAKNIKNKPKINEDPKDALLRQYQEEIAKLKAMLTGQIPLDAGLSVTAIVKTQDTQHDLDSVHEELEQEKQKLKEEYEEKMTEMKSAFEVEKSNKVKLQHDMDKLRAFYDSKVKSLDSRLAGLPSTAQVLGEDRIVDTEFGDTGTSREDRTCGSGENEKRKKKSSPVGTESSTSQDVSLIGLDISDIGKPMILGPDGLPHIEKEVPVAGDKAVMPESLFPEQQEQLQRIQQQQQVLLQQQMDEDSTNTLNASSVRVADMADKQKEALARLLALQNQMVGGENVNNVKVREEHERRLKQAQSARDKLNEANHKIDDDDGIMLGIFDGVQEELRAKNKVLEERKARIESLERDIIDIQSEFEFDRMDYLDTIRKQDRQIAYLECLVDRIHPCLRRDCNYYNLDRIRMESHYSEEDEKWIIPKMVIDRTALPVTGTILYNGRMEQHARNTNNDVDGDGDDDRLREKLRRSQDQSHIFQPKRATQLINSNEPVNKFKMQEVRSTIRSSLPVSSPTVNGYHNTEDPVSKDLWAAQVHGQLHSDEIVRKPVRLEALPSVSGKKSRKKRNSMDQF